LIGHTGASKLAQYLSHNNCNLKKLNIAECKISGKGALTLFESLKKAYTLEQLRADKCDFGSKSIRKLVS
jgi:hypothetical protein